MINLLPPKEKEELVLEIKKNLAITLGGIFLVFLICLILVLMSIRFYILGEIASRSIILNQSEKIYQTPDFILYKTAVQNYNKDFEQILNFYKNQTFFSSALEVVSEIPRPRGLYFTGLSVKRNKDKLSASVSGFAKSREDLLNFKSSIEKAKQISNVYFLPQSWIKPTNINFSLTFDEKSE